MILIPDSSPLISFAIIGRLDLLDKISSKVLVPGTVYSEISKEDRKYSKELQASSKNKIIHCKNKEAYNAFRFSLGMGESECLVLAKEIVDSVLLIDDKKARKIGRMEKARIVGTLGILISAKDKGYVECIRPLIQKLESEKIFMSKVLVEKALFLAEES